MTSQGSVFQDLAEVLWLPLLIGLIVAAVTWLIWYYTGVPCLPETAALRGCNPSRLARYVDVEVWALCLTLGTLTGGLIGGGVNYTMISRERAARIAAETRAESERMRADEERQRADEQRDRMDQMLVQFTETQQALLTAITALNAEVAEMRRQRNGNSGH